MIQWVYQAHTVNLGCPSNNWPSHLSATLERMQYWQNYFPMSYRPIRQSNLSSFCPTSLHSCLHSWQYSSPMQPSIMHVFVWLMLSLIMYTIIIPVSVSFLRLAHCYCSDIIFDNLAYVKKGSLVQECSLTTLCDNFVVCVWESQVYTELHVSSYTIDTNLWGL